MDIYIYIYIDQPRASVTTKTSAFGLGFCLLSPSGHVFHTAWETMIKSYYSTLTDWVFFPYFIHINMSFIVLKWAIFGLLHGC